MQLALIVGVSALVVLVGAAKNASQAWSDGTLGKGGLSLVVLAGSNNGGGYATHTLCSPHTLKTEDSARAQTALAHCSIRSDVISYRRT